MVSWMRFFGGKKVEDFQTMANKNEYIGEAYHTLLELSADEKKRLEYEAREKAIRDYNAAIAYAQKQGEQVGEARGMEIGESRTIKILKMHKDGSFNEEIAEACDVSPEEAERVIRSFYGKD
ncbi:MAG: Rpn family recombination-promoting nuclease/putative transposase [Lachnospiraceae bacterium]|nr:Rpn family recombination-promoting nuclease/putative transposase [Lachnospiraceae bacterium]